MFSFFQGYDYPNFLYYNYGMLYNPFSTSQTSSIYHNMDDLCYCKQTFAENPQKKKQIEFLEINNQTSKNILFQNQNHTTSTKGNKCIESDEIKTKQKKIRKIIEKKKRAGKYLKKNTESNISNQVFSYLFTQSKSEESLRKYLEYFNQCSADKIISFYYYIKLIKNHIKKYFNKKELFALCLFNQNHPAYTQIQKSSKNFESLNIKLFPKLVRLLIFKFLKKESVTSIISSKKLDKQTIQAHLQRTRQIRRFLIESLSQQ